ncbi:hypothetical protein P691DRAFT_767320 [Macrolepiota fuliginosa MF-IS2]|uniref:Uncharacterized protein n=1 Tax=Macrolepiota fuliginosa MF-IS2 TaxID=1400762 RepID=A0A9P5WYL5_9AGAR|nr:hypothetical protein P691DRAFT_767320 [Macrolepiota fuliginosa MF-IS2]
MVHTYMSCCSSFWRSSAILGVVEPIVIMRKSQEKVKEALILEDDAAEQEKLSSETLVDLTDPEDEKTEMHSTEPAAVVPADTPDRNTALNMVWARILTVFEILVGIINLLFLFMRATTVSMVTQWRTISSPHLNFVTVAHYIAQTVVTILCWCMALGALRNPSPLSEIEQKVWRVSCYFLMLQPVILLLAPARMRAKIGECVKTTFYVLYRILYSAARLSIFFIAFYSIRYTM